VLYQLSYFRLSSKVGIFVTTRHCSSELGIALAAPKIPLAFDGAKLHIFCFQKTFFAIFFKIFITN